MKILLSLLEVDNGLEFIVRIPTILPFGRACVQIASGPEIEKVFLPRCAVDKSPPHEDIRYLLALNDVIYSSSSQGKQMLVVLYLGSRRDVFASSKLVSAQICFTKIKLEEYVDS